MDQHNRRYRRRSERGFLSRKKADNTPRTDDFRAALAAYVLGDLDPGSMQRAVDEIPNSERHDMFASVEAAYRKGRLAPELYRIIETRLVRTPRPGETVDAGLDDQADANSAARTAPAFTVESRIGSISDLF